MPVSKNVLPRTKRAPAKLGRVLVLGLGKSGKAACSYCQALLGGRVDELVVMAGSPNGGSRAFAEGLERGGATVVFDDCEPKGSFDLCIASPGISEFSDFYQNAKAASSEIVSEVEFAWRESAEDAVWVAVTGTNGKTTTTALIAHLLQEAGYPAAAVGNIGDTCLEAVAAGRAKVFVAEVSSYQLASTRHFAPNIAILLNITPDHLSWHRSHEAYVAAKLKVFDNLGAERMPSPFPLPGGEDPGQETGAEKGQPLFPALAILDATDPEARAVARRFKALPKEQRGFDYVPIGAAAGLSANMRHACGSEHAAYLENNTMHVELCDVDYSFGPVDDLRIRGGHNAANALAAATCALALGASQESIVGALRSFRPLAHRIEPCGSIEGVACYNDSKATNIDATLKALEAFGAVKPIVLLGGDDKGTDLSDLVHAAELHCKAVVCFGAAGERFFDAFTGSAIPVYRAAGLEAALDEGLAHAEGGDVLILSPACASFDEFDSFEHRGTVFKELVSARSRQRGA